MPLARFSIGTKTIPSFREIVTTKNGAEAENSEGAERETERPKVERGERMFEQGRSRIVRHIKKEEKPVDRASALSYSFSFPTNLKTTYLNEPKTSMQM